MKLNFKTSFRWLLAFAIKILGYLTAINLMILPILWILKILYLFTPILIYEGFFTTFVGILQILGSYIYREKGTTYRLGFRTGWFNFKKFAELKPEERKRYTQEGKTMIMIGLILMVATIIVHFSLTY